MTDLRAAFRELLVSPAKLAQCANATSMTELFALLKRWWQLEHLSDQRLIDELNACNRQPLDLDPEMLATHWLPWRYHAKTQTISWCLPRGRPTEPFFDQYIERCRQLPVNQFLQPKTALQQTLDNIGHRQTPAGFIFHVSRCGSTLVSGCLAELQRTHVLSESPLLTEALLDHDRNDGERLRLLQTLLNLQTRRLPASAAVIVKWNAWDLFHWLRR
ncbi:MAG TPA: sulfotransferase family protein, partial [Gammaproteobacteria bacterium]